MIETKLISLKDDYRGNKVCIHENELLENETKLALSFIERWGMVAGIPDGEDSAGRTKLRLATPDEVIERAFTCARKAYNYARENGLIHKSVSPWE